MSNGLEYFKNELLDVEGHLPELSNIVLGNDPLCLDGTLSLQDEEGRFIDSYRVRIKPTNDYPNLFPLVYELDNRLPHNVDWHIYPDGHFCIKALPEELLICSNGISLVDFIKLQVIPYLFCQKFREEYGYFLNERSHGTEGNLEFFKDSFRTQDLSKIKEYIEYIAKKIKPNRVAECFCGSGIKYRKCHREAFKLFSKLPDYYLTFYINMLNSAIG